MSRYIALLRGINVGRAKRIAMADLRALAEGLGHGRVATLLNSGNQVFESARRDAVALRQELQQAIAAQLGVDCAVVVITAAELDAALAGNPWPDAVDEPSRLLVAFAEQALTPALPLAQQDWGADRLAVQGRLAYLGCSTGILDSPMAKAFARVAGTLSTSRNWATLQKLQSLVRP